MPKGAEPFDIPGVRFSRYRGHCTFYTLLKEHGLKDPILVLIASVIDEADIVQEANVEPAAYGLDLLCRSRDDHEALERGMLIYEALYAELSTGEH